MATFLFDEIIFGPVKSRRLGVSLGINLLPTDSKFCNFNCIYCECGWTKDFKTKQEFHPKQLIKSKLENKLLQMRNEGQQPDVITFAGNGEPTLHPDFAEIINDTVELRDKYFSSAEIAVLSNATMLHKPKVVEALCKIEQNILKLDSAFQGTAELLNGPLSNYSIDKVIENLKGFEGNFILQTMFVKGSYEGKIVDNSTEKDLKAWYKIVDELKPKRIMIYTIARDTPSPDLEKVSIDRLKEIQEELESKGFDVQVSG